MTRARRTTRAGPRPRIPCGRLLQKRPLVDRPRRRRASPGGSRTQAAQVVRPGGRGPQPCRTGPTEARGQPLDSGPADDPGSAWHGRDDVLATAGRPRPANGQRQPPQTLTTDDEPSASHGAGGSRDPTPTPAGSRSSAPRPPAAAACRTGCTTGPSSTTRARTATAQRHQIPQTRPRLPPDDHGGLPTESPN
jgi:hypothetical protein